ncbi:glutathione peroxidase [Marivirga harenae]|uniref:glutathione peroxidase n=1 Tax=uncultured Marivirga sp. TaxID=1123707 RepID=UPI0026DF369A|nr:glutathione peroxidase [Marivirga harenae]WKV14067.1 glutathione peroxidase [Marivirga harenae]
MSIYDFQVQSLEGEMIDFSMYKGKNLLIVNTASECGYTPQYADLQQLHEEFGDEVTVLGFPANNFGGQEPGSDQQIASFCQKNYGVTFTMFSKMDVIGKNQHPLFKFLNDKTGKEPTWNFCKYLVLAGGEKISFYPSSVNPGEIAEKL